VGEPLVQPFLLLTGLRELLLHQPIMNGLCRLAIALFEHQVVICLGHHHKECMSYLPGSFAFCRTYGV
jgi:hypothetical protein